MTAAATAVSSFLTGPRLLRTGCGFLLCPLACPSGKAAQGDQCVVVEQPEPAPAVAAAAAKKSEDLNVEAVFAKLKQLGGKGE